MQVLFPTAGVELNPLLLLLLGFTVGVCGGFMGVGGAFMVTPVLNILGFPMAYAIGTDIAHISGKSVVAALRHRKLGHLDLRMGAITIVGAMLGVELAKRLVLGLEARGTLEGAVGVAYVVVLSAIGGYMVYEYLAISRAAAAREAGTYTATVPPLARAVRRINLPPMIALPQAQVDRISVWVLFAIGLTVGLVAGFLGVGGGFLLMPSYLYLVGAPTAVAVGTDLFTIAVSSAYGTFTYALSDRVDLLAALVMLLGAAGGAQIGAFATKYADGRRIRLYFALMVFLAAIGVALKQLAAAPGWEPLTAVAGVVIMAAAAVMSVVIMATAVRGMEARRRTAAERLRRACQAHASYEYGPWHQGVLEWGDDPDAAALAAPGGAPVRARLD